jgi:hypothetical protein
MHVYMPTSMQAKFRILAASKGLSMSSYAKVLIEEALKELKPSAR